MEKKVRDKNERDKLIKAQKQFALKKNKKEKRKPNKKEKESATEFLRMLKNRKE